MSAGGLRAIWLSRMRYMEIFRSVNRRQPGNAGYSRGGARSIVLPSRQSCSTSVAGHGLRIHGVFSGTRPRVLTRSMACPRPAPFEHDPTVRLCILFAPFRWTTKICPGAHPEDISNRIDSCRYRSREWRAPTAGDVCGPHSHGDFLSLSIDPNQIVKISSTTLAVASSWTRYHSVLLVPALSHSWDGGTGGCPPGWARFLPSRSLGH